MENQKQTIVENELTKAMSNAELLKALKDYPKNQSLQEMVKGILAIREAEAKVKQAEADFAAHVLALANLGAPPTSVHNIYIYGYGEHDVPDMEAPEVDVVITDDLKTTPPTTHVEKRHPTKKVTGWLVETNKGFQVARGATTDGSQAGNNPTKRAETVSKRNGLTLVPVGNFRTGQEAADFLGIKVVGQSANKVLKDEGYILDTYAGTDFTVKVK